MIDDPDHPLMKKAANELAYYLNKYLVGRPLTEQIMVLINNTLVEHRRQCRRKGVDFPVMSALVIPRLGVIELVRADLDQEDIDVRLNNLSVMHPTATQAEIRQALAWAFPDAKPTGFAVFNQ